MKNLKINLKFGNKTFYFLAGIFIIMIIMGFTIAIENWEIHGHTADEIENLTDLLDNPSLAFFSCNSWREAASPTALQHSSAGDSLRIINLPPSCFSENEDSGGCLIKHEIYNSSKISSRRLILYSQDSADNIWYSLVAGGASTTGKNGDITGVPLALPKTIKGQKIYDDGGGCGANNETQICLYDGSDKYYSRIYFCNS